MSVVLEPMPIAWPSLSDLARMLGIELSTFSRLAAVRRRPTQRIGREVKVPPSDAVALLVERGLSHEAATEGVQRVVDRRLERIPALRTPDPDPTADVESRLVRSSFSSLRSARLTPVHIRHAGPRGSHRDAPDMARYAQLDRELGDRIIPIERYVYGNR